MIRGAAPLTIAAVLMVASAACPPAPKPAPLPLPDGGVMCAVACENLRTIGCPEAFADPPCEVVCAKVQAFEMTDLNLACLSAARSKPEARACKSVKCA